MSLPKMCTQMPIPDDLRAQARSLAIQENPLNGRDITTGAPASTDAPDLALPIRSLWKTGRTLRVKILGGSEKIRSKVRLYGSRWTQFANIKMVFVDSGDAEIRVAINSSGSSWSYVGTDAFTGPPTPNDPTMNFGWLTDDTPEDEYARVIIHEFGHAMGCCHEHQSPAAGIPWNKQAVYDYYKRTAGWDEKKTNGNVLYLYDSDLTQFTKFDLQSIMLYPIPKELTTNGFSTDWNNQLSDTDKSYISSIYPTERLEVAYFNTQEVRPWDQPIKEYVKQQDFTGKWTSPPSLVVGLNSLDLANTAGIRVNATANNVSTTSFDIRINTWADTTLWSAGCTWFKAANNDPDYQVGTFCTMEDHPWDKPQMNTSRNITFSRAYAAPPKIVVWLNQLDMTNNKGWRVTAYADNITNTGFTIHLNTWADTVLWSATASWIAYPADKTNVASGTFNTQDVRPWSKPQLQNSGQAKFPEYTFAKNPNVLIAFNNLDIDCSKGLRLTAKADSVSPSGMNWHLDSWADTILYSAGASYFAWA